MKVDITDIRYAEDKIADKQVEFELASFESKLGKFPIIEKAPFELHLENRKNEFLIFNGETDVTVSIPCGRCLEEVAVKLHLNINRKYRLQELQTEEDTSAGELDYLAGCSLDVDQIIYDEILVNWPMKVLCRKDCRGICKRCGVNLNDKTCLCDRTEPDPRMAAIQDIFNQFKEV